MFLLVRAIIAAGVTTAALALFTLAVPRAGTIEPARWFMPGRLGHEPGRLSGPDRRPATFPTGNAFLTRSFGGLRSDREAAWGRRNELTPRIGFSHNLATVFPPELYRTHPEYFPLTDGRRLEPPKGSSFWNPDIARPDVARYAGEAARRHFETNPAAVSFDLGVNDALVWGESPELRALATPPRWFRERPDYSDVVFTFMNRAATELARTHPDRYVGALAYYWCENTPSFPLHPQVIPFLTADRAQGYDSAFVAEERALQTKWGELSRNRAATERAAPVPPPRLGIYDYVYGGGFLIPRTHPRLIADHLRHAAGAGFTDYYAEIYPNWGLDGPMPWLLTQLVRAPETPVDCLLDEYYARYFQEAAEPMRRFYARCEEQWLRQPGPPYWLKHYRNESQAVVFPPAVTAELRALLDEAGRRARQARVRERVAFVGAAFGVTERFVAFKTHRDALLRAALTGGAADRAGLAAGLERHAALRRDFVDYTEALQRREPLAVGPFGWIDYLANDPVGTVRHALDGAVPLRRNLVTDPGLTGALQPPRKIAELIYSVPLPAGWNSRVEPSQYHTAEVRTDGADGRRLRIAGTKDTTLSQWQAIDGLRPHTVAITLRGRVLPGTIVKVVLSWLDASHRHIGFHPVHLPDGEWPEWVTLRQHAVPPAGAAWVGLGLRVQNQVAGEWIEAKDFALRAVGDKQ